MRDILKRPKMWPLWFKALLADALLFIIMWLIGNEVCGSQHYCYYIKSDIDRMADYLALVVVVMAILIPVSIELWKEQFQSHNLRQKSSLDKGWDRQTRERYLDEPAGSIATFTVLCIAVPLVVKSSALFYADVLYGLYVLTYIFYVSFYMRPPDIYDIDELNPDSPDGLPQNEVMNELARATLDKRKQADGTVPAQAGPVWAAQLTEEATLKQLGKWVENSMAAPKDALMARITAWSTINRFLQECDVMLIWQSIDDGELKGLMQKPGLYKKGSAVRTAQLMKTVVDRLSSDFTSYDMIGNLLRLVPIKQVEPQDRLLVILGGSLRILFSKSGENSYLLEESFPEEWTVTVRRLNGTDIMARVTAAAYLEWVRDLQDAQDMDEKAVQQTTEFIFAEVEVMLFSKFVLLWLNQSLLGSENGSAFKDRVDKWHLFGHISRTSAEWNTPDETNEELEARYASNFKAAEEVTVETVKKLSWFRYDYDYLYMLSSVLKNSVRNFEGWSDGKKNSWIQVADMLMLLVEDGSKK